MHVMFNNQFNNTPVSLTLRHTFRRHPATGDLSLIGIAHIRGGVQSSFPCPWHVPGDIEGKVRLHNILNCTRGGEREAILRGWRSLRSSSSLLDASFELKTVQVGSCETKKWPGVG